MELLGLYDWAAIKDLPLSVANDYIRHAIEREQEQELWQMWLSLYPLMMQGWINFMSFDAYKQEVFKPQPRVTEKTSAEVEEEILAVIAAHEGR